MRRRSRPIIPQRRRVFLGCEGQSEQSYAAVLQQTLDDYLRGTGKIPVHLDAVVLGGGDPLRLLQRAQRHLRQQMRSRPPYDVRAILLDHDLVGQSRDRDNKLNDIAERLDLMLIWQRPCHEGLLLRHLPQCQNLQPATASLALQELRQRWSQYQKGLPARQLRLMIDETALRQAFSVEPALAAFLTAVGFA